MKNELITTKITPKALRLVRLISALTDEKQYEVLERVLEQEYSIQMEKESDE